MKYERRKRRANAANAPKLELRREMIRRHHHAPLRVLDLYQGDGVLWGHLRSEFEVERYLGVDKHRRRWGEYGRAERLAVRVAEGFDVVDLDAYGFPWDALDAVMRNLRWPATIFLTYGIVKIRGGQVARSMLDAVGLAELHELVPASVVAAAHDELVRLALDRIVQRRAYVVDMLRAEPRPSVVHYVGLRVDPRG